MDPLQLFTNGSGGLGDFGAGVEALIFVLVVIMAAWAVLAGLRETAEAGRATPLVAGVVRGAVVLGLAGALLFVIRG